MRRTRTHSRTCTPWKPQEPRSPAPSQITRRALNDRVSTVITMLDVGQCTKVEAKAEAELRIRLRHTYRTLLFSFMSIHSHIAIVIPMAAARVGRDLARKWSCILNS